MGATINYICETIISAECRTRKQFQVQRNHVRVCACGTIGYSFRP